jgi:hypothetical protein
VTQCVSVYSALLLTQRFSALYDCTATFLSTPWSVVFDSAERPSFEVMGSMESGFTLSCGELVRAGARALGRVQQAWDEPPARGGARQRPCA